MPLIALCCTCGIIRFFILAIAHVPVIKKGLVKERLLLMPGQQRAFERIIKILFVSDIDVVQCLGQVQHFARTHIDTHLPEKSAKFSQAIEQALPALKLDGPERLRSKVISILLDIYRV